jgi:hypothetical protein
MLFRDLEGRMRGSCLCGKIEFEVTSYPTKIYQCHCSLCRKHSGSSSNSSLVVEATSFNLKVLLLTGQRRDKVVTMTALVKLAALVERIVNPPAGNVVDIRSGRMEAVAD